MTDDLILNNLSLPLALQSLLSLSLFHKAHPRISNFSLRLPKIRVVREQLVVVEVGQVSVGLEKKMGDSATTTRTLVLRSWETEFQGSCCVFLRRTTSGELDTVRVPMKGVDESVTPDISPHFPICGRRQRRRRRGEKARERRTVVVSKPY